MPELHDSELMTVTDGATAAFYGQSVVLGNSIELKYYMTFAGGAPGNDVKLALRYTTVSGTECSIVIPASEFEYRSDLAAYSAKLTTIAAKDMFQTVTAEIFDGNTLISNVLEYSIESYALNRLNQSSNENFKSLVREMVKYGKSAETYFLNKN